MVSFASRITVRSMEQHFTVLGQQRYARESVELQRAEVLIDPWRNFIHCLSD